MDLHRLQTLYREALELAKEINERVLHTAYNDLGTLNNNPFMTGDERAFLEIRMEKCLRLHDNFTLQLLPRRHLNLMEIAIERICSLPGVETADLPATVNRQIEATMFANLHRILDAITVSQNARIYRIF